MFITSAYVRYSVMSALSDRGPTLPTLAPGVRPPRAPRRPRKLPLTAILLSAALILGVFSLIIVALTMHPVLLAEQGSIPHDTSALASTSTTVNHRPNCQDYSDGCPVWAGNGECNTNPKYMLEHCAASCGVCEPVYLHNVGRQVELRPGVMMPVVGFGTAGLGDYTKEAVLAALKAGYRKIDSAEAREWYREDLIGQALRKTNVPREKIFITTKVHPLDLGSGPTAQAVQRSLNELGTSYLDVVMLHYPRCWDGLCNGREPVGTWKESWRTLEALYDKGIIRCLGVSNFDLGEMAELVEFARVKPCIVQSNSEPLRPGWELQTFCKENGIQFEGYSTLGGQYSDGNPVLSNPAVQGIAMGRKKSPAQIVLRWALQQGQSVVPKTASERHMKENADVFSFDLTDDEMSRLDAAAIEVPSPDMNK